MDLSNFKIETENLILKSISLDYKADIFREFTPEITKYMVPKSPEKIEETIEFIKKAMADNKKGKDLQVVVLNKKSQEFIGCGGLHEVNTKTPELGVWIQKAAHGHYFGREAMTALKGWADENLDYDYILYPVAEENYASRRIPEMMGGKVAREFDGTNAIGEKMHELEYRIYHS